ncbi:MAG: TonB-dependent receptor, partial [Leeuwenhoekiella sp.]
VKGKVTDTGNTPVEFCNIMLLKAADSTFIKGAVTEDNGSFIIESLDPDQYIIKSSFVGYKDNYTEPFTLKGDFTVPVIRLEEDSENLDEVVLNYKKPTIQRKIDRLVYNVENTVVSSGNTYDILRKTPGVIIQQDNLLIKNSPATVYINDRRVYLSSTELRSLLEGFSGENVKSIEVITNPPAKYDAQGGAILNITTSKNLSIGYKGSVYGSNTIAILPKYSMGTSQYYKTKGVDLFANYSYNTRSDFKDDDSYINYFAADGLPDSQWKTNFDKTTRKNSHSLNTIFDFTLNEKNSLSISSNILYTPKENSDIAVNTNIYNTQNTLDSLFTTKSKLNDDRTNLLFNATYKSKLNDKGAELTVSGNYIRYDDQQTQSVTTNYFLPQGDPLRTNSFFTDSDQENDIFTGQIDISTQGASTFETGLKFTSSTSQSGYDFYNTEGGSLDYDSSLSDTFKYDEQIYAGYASVNKDWNSWSIKAGIRAEYTDIEGNSLALGQVNTQEYFELFPSAYIMHNLNENNTFILNYNRSVTRPAFSSLNPYRYFLNENNFQSGNPDLRPGFQNKITLDYILKDKYNFSIYYQREENSPQALSYQYNSERYFRSIELNV